MGTSIIVMFGQEIYKKLQIEYHRQTGVKLQAPDTDSLIEAILNRRETSQYVLDKIKWKAGIDITTFTSKPNTLSFIVIDDNLSDNLNTLLLQSEQFRPDEIVYVSTNHINETKKELVSKFTDKIYSNTKNAESALKDACGECSSDWIFYLYSNELIGEEFKDVKSKINSYSGITAYWFPRYHCVNGALDCYIHKILLYPDWQLRLFQISQRKHDNSSTWKSCPIFYREQNEMQEVQKWMQVCNERPLLYQQHNKEQCEEEEIGNGTDNEIDRYGSTVSIVSIIGRNQEQWLDRFLETIDNFDYPRDKLSYTFLINTNYDILDEFSANHKNCTLLQEQEYNLNLKEMPRFLKLGVLRDLLVTEALDLHRTDYLLMIDSDIVSAPDNSIQQLIQPNCDICAPMIFIENFREYKNTYFYDILAFKHNSRNFGHFYPYAPSIQTTNILEVESVGTCYLCNSDIFKNDVWFDSDIGMSEQVGFCSEVHKQGYKVCVNPNVSVLHCNFENYNLKFRR